MKNESLTYAKQAQHMTIEDVEHTANAIAEECGEESREKYLSALFDGLHQIGNK